MVKLEPGTWPPGTRAALERLIEEHAHQDQIAVFDFDNTVIRDDIGDATFEVLARTNRLDLSSIQHLRPGLNPKDQPLPPEVVLDHYAWLLRAFDHQDGHATHAVAYAWLVEAMAGLAVREVVEATERAWQGNGLRRYPKPALFPEMVDLIGLLMRNGIDVYIVSATNVWSVRWSVSNVLNPVLRQQHGVELAPDQVFGLRTVLRDPETGRLYTQFESEVESFILTPHLVPPISTYAGKVATVLTHIRTGPVFLAGGDSPNDEALLQHARHRLRVEPGNGGFATLD